MSTGFWETPISVTIRELSKKHGLTWLRPKMSYHRFTNLGEMLNSDLSGKVMMNIYDEEGEDRESNRKPGSKCENENGECLHGGDCRKKYVIYKLKDSITGKSYIGKTQQQFLKKREQVIILQTSGNVSRLRRTTKLTRKMTHSRGIFPPTVLTVRTPIKSEPN